MQTGDHSADDDSPPLALEVACQASTSDWQIHMEQLFHNARDRFPDVVWELQAVDGLPSEEVWGHKAIVYARAPPTFQARYFSFRPPPVASPSPYCPSPMPAQSAVSLGISTNYDLHPSRSPSPAPSTTPLQVLRLSTTIASSLFSQELEYLYTGKSFGDAFEFLFDSPEKLADGNGDKDRVEKLRKDLVFMWRSRLYSDIRIQLTGDFTSSSSATDDPTVTPVFSSHRFILVSRSPYFRSQLLGSFAPPTPISGQLLTVTLPSPPFTPASLHFTLGFIYTGTLAFSHRTFDLDTAFHIMRSATYLSIVSLHDEIEARIIEEMCHGLFMAYIPFAEYEEITGGKWAAVGCRCRQCARRIPRVLEFALSEDVQNERLANGARRALVGLFGEGWCSPEFASLPSKLRDSLIRGVHKRTIPRNVFPLLYAAHRALIRLGTTDRDLTVVRELVSLARSKVDAVLCAEPEECFEQAEWLSLLDADGSRFEDGEKVEWVMDAIRRGLTVQNAGIVYQTLVSAILLRPHPQDPNETILPYTSGIRQQVELTRMDIIKWLRTRWFSVQQEGGFDTLEGWALKELSHELEVSVEDLFRPNQPDATTPRATTRKSKLDNESETFSMNSSIRASVVSPDEGISPVTLAVPSIAESSAASSVSSVRTGTSTSTARRPVQRPPSIAPSVASTVSRTPRTPTKSTPRTPSRTSVVSPTPPSRVTKTPSTPQSKPSPSVTSSRRSVASSIVSERPKSLAPSVASTIRKVSPSNSRSTAESKTPTKPKTAAPDSRPVSSISMRSDTTSVYKTARTEATEPRSRRNSNASTTSVRTTTSIATAGRKRTTSNASAVGSVAPKKVPPVPKRPPSTLSVRSHVSTVSISNRKAVGKAAAAKAVERRESLIRPQAIPPIRTSKIITQDKGQAKPSPTDEPMSAHTNSNASEASTIKASDWKALARKLSSETITESVSTGTPTVAAPTPRASIIMGENAPPTVLTHQPQYIPQPQPHSQPQLQFQPHPQPQPYFQPTSAQEPFNFGSTLIVGIPCIISSRRIRFRAYARYIGELEGEKGPWIGVEVPVSESWGAEKLENRPWNDGTWGGRRYFDIGSSLEWEEAEERRKRRKEGSGMLSRATTLKREGEQLGVGRPKRLRSVSPAVSDASAAEARGLFVRPSDVIYVVDAEHSF